MPHTRALLLSTLLLAACDVRIASSDNTMIVEGQVTSNGQAVSGATVAAGATSITTDGQGDYSLKVPAAGDRLAVKISAQGFAPTVSIVEHRSGVFHYHADVVLTPPTSMTMGADGGSFTVMAGGQPMTVTVPPGSVPAGAHLEVAAFTAGTGPGAMETMEGDDQKLQTQGMVYVRAADNAGNEMALTGPIGLTTVTAPDLPAEGDRKTYALGEEGIWQPQTTTTATGADFKAQQAGFWNADRAYKTACMKGKLNAPKKTCGGERVKAGGLDGIYTQDTAGQDGQFCVDGPQGWTQGLSVGSSMKRVTFPQAPGSCRSNPGACSDMGDLMVSDADCPKSCDKGTQVDDPNGCKDQNQGTGGGGGGGVGCGPPAGGCGILGGSYSPAKVGNGCCIDQACGNGGQLGSCSDGCGNGWYEVGGQLFGPCAAGESGCLMTAAQGAVNACK